MRNVTQPDETLDAAEDLSAAVSVEQNIATNDTESEEKDPLTLEAILGERDLMDMIENDPQDILNSMQKFGQDAVVKTVMASAHLYGNPVLVKQKMQDMIDHARAKIEPVPTQKINTAFAALRAYAPVQAPTQQVAANSEDEIEYIIEDNVELVTEEIIETVFEIETEKFVTESFEETAETFIDIQPIIAHKTPNEIQGEVLNETIEPIAIIQTETVSIAPISILADLVSPADALIVLPTIATKPVVVNAPLVTNIQNIVTPTVTLVATPKESADEIVTIIAKALVEETNIITAPDIAPETIAPIKAIISASTETLVETQVTVQAGQPSEDFQIDLPVTQIVLEAPVAVPQKIISVTTQENPINEQVKEQTAQQQVENLNEIVATIFEETFVQDIFTPEEAQRILADPRAFVTEKPILETAIVIAPVAPVAKTEIVSENPVMNMARETGDGITSQEISFVEKTSTPEIKTPAQNSTQNTIQNNVTASSTVEKTFEETQENFAQKVHPTATKTLSDITTLRIQDETFEPAQKAEPISVSYSAMDPKASPRVNEFKQCAIMKMMPQPPMFAEPQETPAPVVLPQPKKYASYADEHELMMKTALMSVFSVQDPIPAADDSYIVPLHLRTPYKHSA